MTDLKYVSWKQATFYIKGQKLNTFLMPLLYTMKIFNLDVWKQNYVFVSNGVYVKYSKRKINKLVAKSPYSKVRIVLGAGLYVSENMVTDIG